MVNVGGDVIVTEDTNIPDVSDPAQDLGGKKSYPFFVQYVNYKVTALKNCLRISYICVKRILKIKLLEINFTQYLRIT